MDRGFALTFLECIAGKRLVNLLNAGAVGKQEVDRLERYQ
jgi:hypothetical protein